MPVELQCWTGLARIESRDHGRSLGPVRDRPLNREAIIHQKTGQPIGGIPRTERGTGHLDQCDGGVQQVAGIYCVPDLGYNGVIKHGFHVEVRSW